MTLGIIHAFVRWMLGVFGPGTGRRRKSAPPAAPAPAPMPEAAGAVEPWPPVRRAPCGLEEPLSGAEAALVGPYVLLAERERERARQRRRRLAAVLATDLGIDLDRHVVRAEAVAR